MTFPHANPHAVHAAQPPQAAGGVAPRQVIRGESSEEPQESGKAFGAFTDYLNATFPIPSSWSNPASEFFGRFSIVVGLSFGVMEDLGRGLHGYSRCFRFERGQVRFAFGGQAGTALLTIPGEGCMLIRDWQRLIAFLRDELRARITRWDGAIDDYQ